MKSISMRQTLLAAVGGGPIMVQTVGVEKDR